MPKRLKYFKPFVDQHDHRRTLVVETGGKFNSITNFRFKIQTVQRPCGRMHISEVFWGGGDPLRGGGSIYTLGA